MADFIDGFIDKIRRDAQVLGVPSEAYAKFLLDKVKNIPEDEPHIIRGEN